MITCTFENSDQTSLRHVIVDTLVIKDGKILLAKRGTFKGKPILETGKWGLVGGFVDRDETVEQAVHREVEEETGLKLQKCILLRINDRPDRPREDRQNISFVFIAEAVGVTRDNSEEVRELKWFDLDSIPDQNEIAFDGAENIELYKAYKKNPFPLPRVG